ncbi:MAG: hypothetical protein RLN86_11105 [Cyclobacteriaceae bacterium]
MKLLFAFLLLSYLPAVPLSAQRSGIKGQVYLISSGGDSTPALYQGVPLELFVYPMISAAEVDMEDDAITKIYSQPVERIFSDWNGSFKVKLKPGSYSIFARYKNRFYGNLIDSNGNLSPAIVAEKTYAWTTITIGYQPFH